jgi:hypothetical protein
MLHHFTIPEMILFFLPCTIKSRVTVKRTRSTERGNGVQLTESCPILRTGLNTLPMISLLRPRELRRSMDSQ